MVGELEKHRIYISNGTVVMVVGTFEYIEELVLFLHRA